MRIKERNILYSRGKKEKIVFGIVFCIFALYAFSYIYVVAWTFLSSLKENREFFASPFKLPQKWLFKNYIDAFKKLEYNQTNYVGMLVNSLWFTFGGLIVSLACSTATAYVLAKYKFWGSNAIYAGALFIMIIPIMGSLPAYYKMVSDLRIINSPLFLITFTGGFGFNFFILHAYFRNLSWSYAEAAFIDGAGHFYTFVKVMLPQALPCIFALGVQGFIGFWNDYMTPILYLDDFPTISSGLYYYQEQIKFASNEPVYFAGVLMSMIPALALFVFFSDTIMENTVAGGLKG